MNFTDDQKKQFDYLFAEAIKRNKSTAKAWLDKMDGALDVGSFEPSGLFEARRAFHMVRIFTLAQKMLVKGDNHFFGFMKDCLNNIKRHAQWGSRSTDPYSELEQRHAIEAMSAVLEMVGHYD